MNAAPIWFTWQFAPHRSWPCRLLHHSGCRTAWTTRAVTYVTEFASGQREVKAYIACPCRCHGTVL